MEKYKNKIIGILIFGIMMRVEMLPYSAVVFMLSATALAIYYFNKK
tara:strand:+ start:561 stop:698 length:138 start_codon:yes stop_codon:yes gene_type:complete